MTCADCGATVLRNGATQRYCRPCSAERDVARKRAWTERRRGEPRARRPYRELKSRTVEAGAERSLESRIEMGWSVNDMVDCHKKVRVAVPFDYAASKNAIWRVGRGGHVYARQEATAARDALALKLSSASRGMTWCQGKVWIDVFAEKPNHRGDAVNVIDMVCDAVKDAIGVDDRWFSIARLDWSIVKRSPRLVVGIGQEVMEDHQICSHCGRALALAASHFTRSSSNKSGFSRACRDCSSPVKGAAAPSEVAQTERTPEARRLRAEGRTYAEVAQRLGVSRSTAYRWLNADRAQWRRSGG